MSFSAFSLDQIDEALIRAAIQSGMREGRDLDFKRELYPASDDGKHEFLKDVSAMANAVGGDIVIGIVEEGSVATGPHPLGDDLDKEALRLNGVARTGLLPVVAGLQMKAIPISGGGSFFIIRVPRSWRPPHRVQRGQARQSSFWVRTSAGKAEPDVEELRGMFLQGAETDERILSFVSARLDMLLTATPPVPLQSMKLLVLHIISMTAFRIGTAVPIRAIADDYGRLIPVGSTLPENRRINFDGVLTTSTRGMNLPQRAYVQFHRAGVIESVSKAVGQLATGMEAVDAGRMEGSIVLGTTRFAQFLDKHGFRGPYAVVASLVGMEGTEIVFPHPHKDLPRDPLGSSVIDRDRITLASVVLDAAPPSNADAAIPLRPLLDQLANLSGAMESPFFEPDGSYSGVWSNG